MVTRSASQPLVIERHWTVAEYRRLPEGPPYYELEEGRLIELYPGSRPHQHILAHLGMQLDGYLRQNPIGDVWPAVEVVLTPRHVYVPDLSFLLKDNSGRFADDIAIDGPPDLVVEVVAPSTAVRDKAHKLQMYHKTDVPWCWLVETESLVITEYRHTSAGYLVKQTASLDEVFAPTLFPGLAFRMADLAGVDDR
jgi:Uma2 family endonuclease